MKERTPLVLRKALDVIMWVVGVAWVVLVLATMGS
jgi:hypothetical protein